MLRDFHSPLLIVTSTLKKVVTNNTVFTNEEMEADTFIFTQDHKANSRSTHIARDI